MTPKQGKLFDRTEAQKLRDTGCRKAIEAERWTGGIMTAITDLAKRLHELDSYLVWGQLYANTGKQGLAHPNAMGACFRKRCD
jgi:ribosomal protein S2